MADYNEPHLLLRWGGTLFEEEEWSCQVRGAIAGGGTEPDLDVAQGNAEDLVDQFWDACAAYVARTQTHQNGLSTLNWVRLNVIQPDGQYAFPNTPVIYEDTPVAGTGFGGPGQVAYAVTLRSGEFRRPPGAWGRWFVPSESTTGMVTTTGVMPAQDATDRAGSAATFLETIRAINPGGPGISSFFIPSVFGRSSKPGVASRRSVIATVEVGNVYDTQRRRRNRVAETYYDGDYD